MLEDIAYMGMRELKPALKLLRARTFVKKS